MSNERFFSISGIGVAQHTPETHKKWLSLPNDRPKSDYGKQAILKFAKNQGFEYTGENINSGVIEEAFNFLLNQFPKMTGIKSYIIRQAIIHYS